MITVPMARAISRWPRTDDVPQPMTATLAAPGEVPLTSQRLVYEPKYDVIRAIAVIRPGSPTPSVALYSRNGNDKAAQFPEVVRALRVLAASLTGSTVLDGEIVALDARGEPTSFTRLQGRMHLSGARDIDAQGARVPTAFIVFDLLRVGDRKSTRLNSSHVKTSYDVFCLNKNNNLV